MEVKYICNECSNEVTDKTKFCPHCGCVLEMVELTYKRTLEIKFTKKPKSCCDCRFGGGGYEKGLCLLNPDIKFLNYNSDNYYGFYGNRIKVCPIY